LGFSQETITVTLRVDTKNFDANDLNSYCSFEAVWSNSDKVVTSNGDLENFEINVFVDDTVIWEGTSTTSDMTIIDIKKVVRENSSKIFKDKRNYGQKLGNSQNEAVKARVLYDTKEKPDYKYKIFFKINQTAKIHKIDPKIKVGTRG
jgi:hypothetical protein